jgi:opacity protein-like surface antigen
VRVPLGDTLTTVALSYGMLGFVVSLPGSVAATGDVPELGYQYIRAGVDFRYAIGAASVLAGGAYRHILGTGELGEDVFPGSSAIGYDASLGLAYQLLDHVELQLAGKYSGFIHDLKSNDTYEASGATDVYLDVEVGLSLFF